MAGKVSLIPGQVHIWRFSHVSLCVVPGMVEEEKEQDQHQELRQEQDHDQDQELGEEQDQDQHQELGEE